MESSISTRISDLCSTEINRIETSCRISIFLINDWSGRESNLTLFMLCLKFISSRTNMTKEIDCDGTLSDKVDKLLCTLESNKRSGYKEYQLIGNKKMKRFS
jgi:hypothetical protein